MDAHQPHPCTLPDDDLLRVCAAATGRRRGPGGQHRNKTESAVVLVHEPTGIVGQAAERRSQAENRHQALKRLRVNLALEVRGFPPEEPSALWRSRTPQGRIVINPEHHDFATLLAEALDVVSDRHGEVTHAAEHLGCSFSQLRKFLRLEPRAWTLVNAWRQRYGQRELP